MRELICLAAGLWLALAVSSVHAQRGAGAPEITPGAPVFNASGELVRPLDYRQWTFVTSGLGMTYGPDQPAEGRPQFFDNVFVTRDAYAAFLTSGRWPEGTTFILEGRAGVANVSINKGGRTQGSVAFIEAAVKDSVRYEDRGGWAYFRFTARDELLAAAPPQPPTASCYSCHAQNTAVDNTFVQFYPELFAVAQRHGTVKASYRD